MIIYIKMVATMCSMFTMLVVLVLPCCAQISTLGRVHIEAQWKSTGDVFFVSWYFVSLHYEHT